MTNSEQNNKNQDDAYSSFMNKYVQQKKEHSDKEKERLKTINELKRHLKTNYNIFNPTSLLEKIENNEITTIEELDFEVKKYEEELKIKSKLEKEEYDDIRNKITQQKLEDGKHIKENLERKNEAIKRFEEEKEEREELKLKQRKRDNTSKKLQIDQSTPKTQLPENGEVEIEIIKKVRPNIALINSILFLTNELSSSKSKDLATGLLLAAAQKEEVKWVKTILRYDNEKIEIMDPHYKIRYKDMKKIQTGQFENRYLFNISFGYNKEIFLKTKYEYLYEIINENFSKYS